MNLARCIYSRSRTIYLDDILSAVDAHTAQFIVQECFQGDLVKGRTVVLVSHHVAICLPAADFVISLKEGRVEQACLASEANVEELEEFDVPSPTTEVSFPMAKHANLDQVDAPEDVKPDSPTRQVYTTEVSSVGRVAQNHYLLVFAAAGGAVYWLVLAFIFGASTAFTDILIPLFFRHWTDDAAPSHLDRNLYIYLSLVTATVVLGGMRWVWLYGMFNFGFYNRGSRKIHSMLLDMICSAPLSFFESTPKGRLMNIFGGDMYRLDGNSADDFGRKCIAIQEDLGANV